MTQAQNAPAAGLAPAVGPVQLISNLLGEPNTHNLQDMTILLRVYGDILLDESGSQGLVIHTLSCLKNNMSDILRYERQIRKPWSELFVKALLAVKRLTNADVDSAIQAMAILSEMAEKNVTILDQHLKMLLKFCLEILTNPCNRREGDRLISGSLSLLKCVHWFWRETIVDLTIPVLRAVFPYLCSYKNSKQNAQDLENTHEYLAAQVVSQMADCRPPQRFYPALFKHVMRALDNPSPLKRRSAFMALTACSRGGERRFNRYYLLEYTDKFLFPWVYVGLADSSPLVCQTALVALGHFSGTFQPNIAVHLATSLRPLLFECLTKISSTTALSSVEICEAYTALKMICDSLHKEIVHYLDDLIRFILNMLQSLSTSAQVKELAMDALVSVAAAAGTDLVPYLPACRSCLDTFFVSTEGNQILQSSAFLCLTALSKYVREQFCQTIKIQSQDKVENEKNEITCDDLCGLLGGISAILEEETRRLLKVLILVKINSDELSTGPDKLGSDTEVQQACLSLGTIARGVGPLFLPYLRETYQAIRPLLENRDSSIRSSAVKSLGDICCAVWIFEKEGGGVKREVEMGPLDRGFILKALSVDKERGGDQEGQGAELHEILGSILPKYLSTIRSDESPRVCIDVLKTLDDMIKVIGPPVFKHAVLICKDKGASDGNRDGGDEGGIVIAVQDVIMEVLLEGTLCHNFYTDETENDLIELKYVARHWFPFLASTAKSEDFSEFFTDYLDMTLSEFSNSHVGWAESSDLYIVINLFAEVVKNMGSSPAAPFADRFYAMLVEALEYEDVRTRMDAAYGLGMLIGCDGESTISKYNDTLQRFNRILDTETNVKVIDKVYAAICRMIASSPDSVPLNDYLPSVISRLPLQHDYIEWHDFYDNNLPVYQCLLSLYRSSMLPHIEGLLAKLITVAGQLLDESRINKKMRTFLADFLSEMERKEKAVISRVLEEVNLGTQRSIRACLSEGSWSGRVSGGMAHFI